MHYVDMATRLFWVTHLFHLQLMSHLFDMRKRTQIIVLKCLIETPAVNFKGNYFYLIHLSFQNYVYFSKHTSVILYSTQDTPSFLHAELQNFYRSITV